MDARKKRVVPDAAPGDEAGHNVLTGDRALQLLPVQQITLDLGPALAAGREGRRALAVAAAVAGGDEVGDAAALKKRSALHPAEEVATKALHLTQADAHDGRLHAGLQPLPDTVAASVSDSTAIASIAMVGTHLGVAAQAEAVAEASAERDDVLERTAQLDAGHVVDRLYPEGGPVEEEAPRGGGGGVSTADGRLAELVLSHLIRHVGTHEHTDRHRRAQRLVDHAGDELRPSGLELDAFDERDRLAPRRHAPQDVGADSPEELVGQHEDQHRRTAGGARQAGIGDDVGR